MSYLYDSSVNLTHKDFSELGVWGVRASGLKWTLSEFSNSSYPKSQVPGLGSEKEYYVTLQHWQKDEENGFWSLSISSLSKSGNGDTSVTSGPLVSQKMESIAENAEAYLYNNLTNYSFVVVPLEKLSWNDLFGVGETHKIKEHKSIDDFRTTCHLKSYKAVP